jgi:hypothetical protein
MPTITIMAPGWEEKIKVAVAPYIRGVSRDIADDVKSNLLKSHNITTGALYRSVSSTHNSVRVGTDHWSYIEFGTERHIIKVKRKKVLASATQVFGKMVKHPGNRAYAPIRRAAYKRRRLHKY